MCVLYENHGNKLSECEMLVVCVFLDLNNEVGTFFVNTHLCLLLSKCTINTVWSVFLNCNKHHNPILPQHNFSITKRSHTFKRASLETQRDAEHVVVLV